MGWGSKKCAPLLKGGGGVIVCSVLDLEGREQRSPIAKVKKMNQRVTVFAEHFGGGVNSLFFNRRWFSNLRGKEIYQ